MSKILKVKARQVFDSRGNPTVEAEVFIKNISSTNDKGDTIVNLDKMSKGNKEKNRI